MSQFKGKDSKRHFTVVMGGKENGLYVSSTPSSAAKKAVTKLCAANKSKKVEFHIREITLYSKKKNYGPYIGYLEKLKIPIKFKEYILKYNPVAKLKKKTIMKKIRMIGGSKEFIKNNHEYRGLFLIKIDIPIRGTDFANLLYLLIYESKLYQDIMVPYDKKSIEFPLNINITEEILSAFLNNQDNKNRIIDEMKKLRIREKIKIILQIPYMVDDKPNYEEYLYMEYDPNTNSNFPNNERNRPLIQAPNQNTSNKNSFSSNMNNTDYRKRYSKLMMMIYSKEFNKEYLNNALKYFLKNKFQILYHIFYFFLNEKTNSKKDRIIISVGSGNAYFEYLFKNTFDIPEIICIDPEPNIFLPVNKDKFIEPRFPTVDILMLSNNRNHYKDSLLILNWVYPNLGPYDVEAIQKLNPIRIFIIYEDSGGAGSKDFHQNFKNFPEKYGYTSYMKKNLEDKIYFEGELIITFVFVIECYKRI
jgi:hypothetical protein